MADLLTQRLGLTAAGGTMLMSADGQLQVSQVVDPLKTARYAMPVEILAQFGRRLFRPTVAGRSTRATPMT